MIEEVKGMFLFYDIIIFINHFAQIYPFKAIDIEVNKSNGSLRA